MKTPGVPIIIGVIVLVFALLGFGSYNSLVAKDQAVATAWAQVQTDYQRRADLVPNLVATVKGAANFEKSTLTAVVDARARATGITLKASDLTPDNIAKYESAQSSLSGALSRLLVVSESYPTLTATESFKGLQTQLEGTENRIAVSRRDFNTAVQNYDTSIRTFPGSLIAGLFGFKDKAYFTADPGASTVPTVSF